MTLSPATLNADNHTTHPSRFQGFAKQLEKIHKSNIEEFKKIEDFLKLEESSILSQKNILSGEEFDKRINSLKKKINE